ncbi:MAG: protein phosphatase CheZ [Hyphomonadaceae bacterium]|jgi:chemotaxis protein CheZ|uniref:protein phosphatase CheZ n=1 Tax=Aquidulcibacter sp. TaxID=2052990 RepID=UPI0022C30475|nr:protein phosphatase CheZ [Aquidulcibacter sp.]MCE2890865.1 protein phosphatase CheZ [Hyphomonadaceae bacterium]MCZ8209541.1 protein phosphatase CheZ [Aquidulcibacter sp.]
MPSPEVANKVRDAITALKGADLKDPRLGEVLNLASQMSEAMQMFFSSLDRSLFDEMRYISSYIQRTRLEISNLRPNDLSEDRIPGAGAELHAVVQHTAEATNLIMAVAEDVMAADTSDPAAYQAFVSDKMMEIFEACTFQDITGQRIKKVVDTLTHIEQRLERFASVMGVEDAELEETLEDKRKRENLLNGPALNGPEVAQDDIDALFGTEGASMDQSDLDALFD